MATKSRPSPQSTPTAASAQTSAAVMTDHAVAAEEDHPGAEEADAAHHLGGDAADVGTGRARHVEGAEAGDGEGGGAERDQRVGAHPRRLGGQLALRADQHAERGGERHPAEQLGLGGTGHRGRVHDRRAHGRGVRRSTLRR